MGRITQGAHPEAASVLMARHSGTKSETGKSYGVIAQELGMKRTQRAAICDVAHGKRLPSRDLIERMNRVYGCHLHLKTVKIVAPVCPVCDQPYEPRHKCADKPRTPRRKYDMSNREARDIGLGLLAVLNTSPLRNAPELRRRLALKRHNDEMG